MPLSIDTILGIIGLALTILSPVVGIVFAWYNRYHYSWKKILGGVKQLHLKLLDQGVQPDLILAFAKGGLIVADLLNGYFNNSIPIITIYTKRSVKGGERIVEVDTTYVNLFHIKGKNIILVDDVVQSGSSLHTVVNFLVSRCGAKRENITVVVLATSLSVTLFQPDIYAYEFEYGKKRPILPWGPVPKD